MKFLISKFISNRLINSTSNNFSKAAYDIGITTIALGISSMLIFSLLLSGLQKSISSKIFNMSGHIHIKKTYFINSIEEHPFPMNNLNVKKLLNKIPEIQTIIPFAHITAIVKGKENLNGIIFKGIDTRFNCNHLKKYIYKGRFFSKDKNNKEIILSKKFSDQLKIKLGDSILCYFLTNPERYRKLKVIGIYKTNIPDIDEKFGLAKLSLIQELNSWSEDTIGGYEILLKDLSKLDKITLKVRKLVNNLNTISIKRKFTSIFDWLLILEKNKNILFVLIMIVICANIASIILIQLINRTYMTGVLISLGANNNTIASIFIWNVIQIVFRGVFYGNIIGLTLCAFQHFTKFFKLDPDGVYLDYAIIDWNFKNILFVNLISVFVISIITICFIYIILKIRPIKALEFR
ncbi:MAG: ABC transporter permease [Bacteroidetes bacterium]|nr:ABC transporter permease [Bacteroidota bacterium]